MAYWVKIPYTSYTGYDYDSLWSSYIVNGYAGYVMANSSLVSSKSMYLNKSSSNTYWACTSDLNGFASYFNIDMRTGTVAGILVSDNATEILQLFELSNSANITGSIFNNFISEYAYKTYYMRNAQLRHSYESGQSFTVVRTGIYNTDVYESFDDMMSEIPVPPISSRLYPITYRNTNTTSSGPEEAAVSDIVTVNYTFPEGYGIANPSSDIYVTNNGVVIPSTYSNGVLTFTMPDQS